MAKHTKKSIVIRQNEAIIIGSESEEDVALLIVSPAGRLDSMLQLALECCWIIKVSNRKGPAGARDDYFVIVIRQVAPRQANIFTPGPGIAKQVSNILIYQVFCKLRWLLLPSPLLLPHLLKRSSITWHFTTSAKYTIIRSGIIDLKLVFTAALSWLN